MLGEKFYPENFLKKNAQEFTRITYLIFASFNVLLMVRSTAVMSKEKKNVCQQRNEYGKTQNFKQRIICKWKSPVFARINHTKNMQTG